MPRMFDAAPASGLNAAQRQQELARLFGLEETMSTPQFSHEEIERLRALVEAHDAQSSKNHFAEFDLNNPPKKPYVYHEFPRMVYHHASGKTKIIHTTGELAHALERGYERQPLVQRQPEEDETVVELDAEIRAELEAAEAKLRTNKKAGK